MLMVRRSLTEILLEVTNEEIGVVCREVWSHARTKGTPDTHDRTNRLNFRTFTRRRAESNSKVNLLAPRCNQAVRLCNTNLEALNGAFFNA